MSTILDALRKLQRERSAANPSRDLRGSVTDEIPMPQPRRPPPRRGLALGVLAASLAVLAGVGGTWLYKRGVFTRAPAAPGQVAAGPQAAPEPEEAQEEFPTEAELDELERENAANEAANQAPPPVAASPTPPPVPATNAEEAAAERARLEEVRRAAAAADEERRQAEARAAADAAADAATAVDASEPPTAAMAAPPPVLAPPPAPPTLAQAPKAAPAPVAKPKPAPKAKPAPLPEPARREPPPDSAPDALAPTAFPEVRVESIRWHPLAERRAASLRFAQQNVADAHEGDIVGGVLVFRIEPGAVELRVGSSSRVVRPSP